MVGTSPPPGLCSFSTQRRCSVDVKTITELRISAIKQDQRGWMSENYLFLQRREKCFLLTSPFIEPGNPRLLFTIKISMVYYFQITIHIFSNTAFRYFQKLSTDEICTLSLGLWGSTIVGPNDTISIPGYFSPMTPHSNPACIAISFASSPKSSLWTACSLRTMSLLGSGFHPG